MKGISHFASGVAAASFFPWAIAAAQQQNPMYFILGGACGLLPDTLDFKVYRFFYKHDLYIEPNPLEPDPQAIADALADAVKQARKRDKPYRVKLSTIRLGADYWQQYVVKFDSEKQEVLVRFGPVVNTGQVPVPNTAPEEAPVGRAKLDVPIEQSYDATTRVDIFDGPTFGFEANDQGGITLQFLPWHREWTHSLVVGGLLALAGGLIWDWRASAVMMAGYSVHVLEDQLGFMGSNLFAPLTKIRFPGIHWMRSGDAMPNFSAVWISCLLIFWNVYRAIENPLYDFGFLHVILFGLVVPVGLFMLVLKFAGRKDDEEEELEMEDEWGDKV